MIIIILAFIVLAVLMDMHIVPTTSQAAIVADVYNYDKHTGQELKGSDQYL